MYMQRFRERHRERLFRSHFPFTLIQAGHKFGEVSPLFLILNIFYIYGFVATTLPKYVPFLS
jgi:hypothetical protein